MKYSDLISDFEKRYGAWTWKDRGRLNHWFGQDAHPNNYPFEIYKYQIRKMFDLNERSILEDDFVIDHEISEEEIYKINNYMKIFFDELKIKLHLYLNTNYKKELKEKILLADYKINDDQIEKFINTICNDEKIISLYDLDVYKCFNDYDHQKIVISQDAKSRLLTIFITKYCAIDDLNLSPKAFSIITNSNYSLSEIRKDVNKILTITDDVFIIKEIATKLLFDNNIVEQLLEKAKNHVYICASNMYSLIPVPRELTENIGDDNNQNLIIDSKGKVYTQEQFEKRFQHIEKVIFQSFEKLQNELIFMKKTYENKKLSCSFEPAALYAGSAISISIFYGISSLLGIILKEDMSLLTIFMSAVAIGGLIKEGEIKDIYSEGPLLVNLFKYIYYLKKQKNEEKKIANISSLNSVYLHILDITDIIVNKIKNETIKIKNIEDLVNIINSVINFERFQHVKLDKVEDLSVLMDEIYEEQQEKKL